MLCSRLHFLPSSFWSTSTAINPRTLTKHEDSRKAIAVAVKVHSGHTSFVLFTTGTCTCTCSKESNFASLTYKWHPNVDTEPLDYLLGHEWDETQGQNKGVTFSTMLKVVKYLYMYTVYLLQGFVLGSERLHLTAHVHYLESGNNEEQANGCCKSTRRRVEAIQRLRVAQRVMLQE